MSRFRTIARLAARNSAQSPGRILILVLLLSAALVARSAVYLVQSGLCAEAVEGASGEGQRSLPRDFNTVALSPETSYPPESAYVFVWQALSFMPWDRPPYLTANCTKYLGPGGEIWVVRPCDQLATRYTHRGPVPLGHEEWYSALEGRFPERADEVAVPAPFAASVGLELGDSVSLLEKGPYGTTAVFTVSGIYEPRGKGPFFEYFLSIVDPSGPPAVNWISLKLRPGEVNLLRSFGGDPASGYTATWVQELIEPQERMMALAQAVYGAQSTAANTGFALVGVAVLVVLLVAMVERKREAAVYKMVGMNSLVTLSVLTLELVVALVVALALAAPIYWLLATRFILDVFEASFAVLAGPFIVSAAWTVVIAALGAAYPFALASVGTPNQLLTSQKIYLFRRKQMLRGWADIDVR